MLKYHTVKTYGSSQLLSPAGKDPLVTHWLGNWVVLKGF